MVVFVRLGPWSATTPRSSHATPVRRVGAAVAVALMRLVHAPTGLPALPVTFRLSPATGDERDDAEYDGSYKGNPSKRRHVFSSSAVIVAHVGVDRSPNAHILETVEQREYGTQASQRQPPIAKPVCGARDDVVWHGPPSWEEASMSWDVYVQDIPPAASTPADIPDDFQPVGPGLAREAVVAAARRVGERWTLLTPRGPPGGRSVGRSRTASNGAKLPSGRPATTDQRYSPTRGCWGP